MEFKDWLRDAEQQEVMTEGLVREAFRSFFLMGALYKPLFETAEAGGEVCLNTPLSAYRKEIEYIKSFAQSGPDQMAQVLMFSPLTANVGFAAHWDNFPIMMNILKTFFPNEIDLASVMSSTLRDIPLNVRDAKGRLEYDSWPSEPSEILRLIVMSFDAPRAKLRETIAGWKFRTIAYIWNNRRELYAKCMAANASGDDRELLRILSMIPGAGAVKGGFMAQLVFGRIGCIDTHNVDIYRTVYPDLASIIEPKQWNFPKRLTKADLRLGREFPASGEKKIDRYLDAVKRLADRHIGSQQLWDVWVDFVAKFYAMASRTGTGPYAELGAALDPQDPALHDLSGREVEKSLGRRKFMVPVASGDPAGGGASMTHIIAAKEPDEMLRAIATQDKEKVEPWARSVNLAGMPRARRYGLTTAVTDSGLDRDKLGQVLAHQVRRVSGAPLDPHIKAELDQIEKMRSRRSRRGGGVG